MAYIFDINAIRESIGKISTFQLMYKEFVSKVHLADFGRGFHCNIKEIDTLTDYHRKLNPNIGISIGFVVLERGLLICCHYEHQISYVGIKNNDIKGWSLMNFGGDWCLLIFTHTNNNEQIRPIQFFVKNQNLPKVRDYFTKYGFKELL